MQFLFTDCSNAEKPSRAVELVVQRFRGFYGRRFRYAEQYAGASRLFRFDRYQFVIFQRDKQFHTVILINLRGFPVRTERDAVYIQTFPGDFDPCTR